MFHLCSLSIVVTGLGAEEVAEVNLVMVGVELGQEGGVGTPLGITDYRVVCRANGKLAKTEWSTDFVGEEVFDVLKSVFCWVWGMDVLGVTIWSDGGLGDAWHFW